ncbi:hypothetical protein BHE74_00011145 [Ensete ventricosum]|nr:hypothetical protein BHE74_00011145 [Ensete ventricosum]RZR81284.1 hypothetical protein BHM03_00007477 [Ensete ventricosum]
MALPTQQIHTKAPHTQAKVLSSAPQLIVGHTLGSRMATLGLPKPDILSSDSVDSLSKAILKIILGTPEEENGSTSVIPAKAYPDPSQFDADVDLPQNRGERPSQDP